MVATYLIRRNGRYHFRMRVPQDLLTVIKSREIHRSLGTTDGRAAKALALTLKVKLESEFSESHWWSSQTVWQGGLHMIIKPSVGVWNRFKLLIRTRF